MTPPTTKADVRNKTMPASGARTEERAARQNSARHYELGDAHPAPAPYSLVGRVGWSVG